MACLLTRARRTKIKTIETRGKHSRDITRNTEPRARLINRNNDSRMDMLPLFFQFPLSISVSSSFPFLYPPSSSFFFFFKEKKETRAHAIPLYIPFKKYKTRYDIKLKFSSIELAFNSFSWSVQLETNGRLIIYRILVCTAIVSTRGVD